ncbi:MAG: peptide deformylase [Bacteroidales bacterium]|nr:peptide deformylase [Bacteroidales bacterium]
MKKYILPIAAVIVAAAALIFICRKPFSRFERTVIEKSDSLMYVLTMPEDSTILRAKSRNLSRKELRSSELATLLDKMLYSVQHPSQDGVGIAAPQVGLNVRVVCVRRMDKIGAPFESYLNIKIDSLGGNVVSGPEGCLSVPPYRGFVKRYQVARISYVQPVTLEKVTEDVEGYTAVIFQHECDHLDGVLYTDRADTVFVSQAWAEERAQFTYEKPSWLIIP